MLGYYFFHSCLGYLLIHWDSASSYTHLVSQFCTPKAWSQYNHPSQGSLNPHSVLVCSAVPGCTSWLLPSFIFPHSIPPFFFLSWHPSFLFCNFIIVECCFLAVNNSSRIMYQGHWIQLIVWFKKFLSIYLWLCWVFLAALTFSLVSASRGYSLVAVSGLLLLQNTGSRNAGFSSCSMWAQ